MSIFPIELQIISDLHLETPLLSPSYSKYEIDIQASNLCLLGDIGLVKDDAFFDFLRANLQQSRGHRIFYIIGNHEAYQLTFSAAIERLRAFEAEAKSEYGGRFILLHRNRYDLDASTTLLGCPLWTAISPEQAAEAQTRLTDVNEERGIRGWTLEDHITQHRQDLEWLNAQIQELQKTEPHRKVAILTHHSPTIDTRAIDPRQQGSSQSTCFATDLSNEPCWTSPMVRLWAFGHTHFSCTFRDEKTGKLVVANQGGYQRPGTRVRKAKTLVVELGKGEWRVKEEPVKPEITQDQSHHRGAASCRGDVARVPSPTEPRVSWLEKAAKKFRFR